MTGHTSRVLFMAMGPDGEMIATASPDGCLKLWKPFNKIKQ